MKELLFLEDGKGQYVADFISSGRTSVHINRTTKGELKVMTSIGDLPPVTIYRFGEDSAPVLMFDLCLVAGVHITLKSCAQVIAANIIDNG